MAIHDVTFNDPHACWQPAGLSLLNVTSDVQQRLSGGVVHLLTLSSVIYLDYGSGLKQKEKSQRCFIHLRLLQSQSADTHCFNPLSLQIHLPNYIHCFLNPCQCRAFHFFFFFFFRINTPSRWDAGSPIDPSPVKSFGFCPFKYH